MMDPNFEPNELSLKNISNLFGNMNDAFFEYLIEDHVETEGMSQRELGNIFGVGESTYNAWVKNRKYPDYAKIIFGMYITFENLKSIHSNNTKITEMTHCLDMNDEFGLINIHKNENDNYQAKLVSRGIQDLTSAEVLVRLINLGESVVLSQIEKEASSADEEVLSGDKLDDKGLIDNLRVAIDEFNINKKPKPIIKAILKVQKNSIEDETSVQVQKLMKERLSKEDYEWLTGH